MEKIDWDYWLMMDSVQTWEAALLSVNINPIYAYFDGFIDGHANILLDRNNLPSIKDQEAFIKRLLIVENNHTTAGYDYGFGKLNLLKFIDWLAVKNQDMPNEMRAFVNADTAEAENNKNSSKRTLLQEKVILDIILKLKLDPHSLPKKKKGKPTVKREIKEIALLQPRTFTNSTFEHAWERLTKKNEIDWKWHSPEVSP